VSGRAAVVGRTTTTLTDQYLAAAAERGPTPSRLLEKAGERLARTNYRGRCLSRPVFISRAELDQLHGDVEALHAALTGLPDRVFGGDLAAFARAAGMTELQTEIVVRGRSRVPSRLCRADFIRDASGFRVIELNVGGTVGGLDNALLNEMVLEEPFVADFVAEHGLRHVDTMAELALTVLIEAKVPTGRRPYVAVVDTAANLPLIEDVLVDAARQLAPHGLDCEPAALERLEYHDDRVWLGERPVDVVYRVYLIEEVLKPGVAELLEPLLVAVERGQVALFTPLDAELYGSKGALALVSDERYRDRYTPDELARLDRILPWTRMVRPGPVTVGGRQLDLHEYAVANQAELVLKPVAEHGGQGVVLGWEADPAGWRDRLRAAMDRPYVIQERVRAVPELFPTDDGVEPWVLQWGVLLVARGYGGTWVRGSRNLDGDLVSMDRDASATCCFHEE
jgi:hypothetical protein